MAWYKVTGKELTGIADAIRIAGGTSASISYPAGFLSAMNDLEEISFSNAVERNVPFFHNSEITSLKPYAFFQASSLRGAILPECLHIKSSAFYQCNKLRFIDAPKCTSIGYMAFAYCSSLTSADFPECITQAGSAFRQCTSLTFASLPKLSAFQSSAFYGCVALTDVYFPSARHIYGACFRNCSALESISFPMCTQIDDEAFRGCVNLISVFLLGSSRVYLSASNAFSSTPIGGYSDIAGQFGNVFVPQSLLSAYQTASNWSYIASRIVGVEI